MHTETDACVTGGDPPRGGCEAAFDVDVASGARCLAGETAWLEFAL